MADKVLTEFKKGIREFKLIPSGGGCFEIKVNGELIYSKLATGSFPEEKWVLEALNKHLPKR